MNVLRKMILGLRGWIAPGATVFFAMVFTYAYGQDTNSKPSKSDTIDVVLSPAQELDPPLQLRFWPSPEHHRKRNAMTILNRALILAGQVGYHEGESPSGDVQSVMDELIDQPLEQFDSEVAKKVIDPFRKTINELRRGENWMGLGYDLGMEEMSMVEKINTWLPEYQEFRLLARLIATQAKISVKENRWEDAVAELRLGFRLAHVTARSTELLIGRLVGIAIAEQMYEIVEVMITQPDCPSLYWALATIPVDTLYEMSSSIEYESYFASMSGHKEGLRDLPSIVLGEREALNRIEELKKALVSAIGGNSPPKASPIFELSTSEYIAAILQQSRQTLSASDQWKDRIDELSDAEIVLRAGDIEMRRIRDFHMRWVYMPRSLWRRYEQERDKDTFHVQSPKSLGAMIASLLLPAVEQAADVEYRVKQYHNQLMTIEAIRLAANETGNLPESIDRLSPVPAWPDAISGEQFGYAKESDTTAILTRSSKSPKDVKLRYQIKLRSKPRQ